MGLLNAYKMVIARIKAFLTIDMMEYATDGAAQAAYVTSATAYTSQYPPAQSDTYVKATVTGGGDVYPYNATNPAASLTGVLDGNSWQGDPTGNIRFHIDLGSAKVITRIYYENSHDNGWYLNTTTGAKNFTFWGSNTAAAFADLTYGTDTNWVELTCDVNIFEQHIAANQADPKIY